MENNQNEQKSNYGKMGLMLAASFVILYVLQFLNVDSFSHIYLSLTRTYIALLMISALALLMLAIMRNMYTLVKLNSVIAISAVAVFVFALTALRSQAFVGDAQYMKEMIPQHSAAILLSKNANLRDAEVRRLSDSIVKSHEAEIGTMKQLLETDNY